jgi:hypothetical protein
MRCGYSHLPRPYARPHSCCGDCQESGQEAKQRESALVQIGPLSDCDSDSRTETYTSPREDAIAARRPGILLGSGFHNRWSNFRRGRDVPSWTFFRVTLERRIGPGQLLQQRIYFVAKRVPVRTRGFFWQDRLLLMSCLKKVDCSTARVHQPTSWDSRATPSLSRPSLYR